MTTLTGDLIELRPLQAGDADALVQAAADGELWRLTVTVVPSRETVVDYIGRALRSRDAGTMLPFATVHRASGRVIGSTRLWRIDRENRSLEIGGTWLAQSWQRTRANTEAKWLLLGYAFDVLDCIRVQLTTDVLNDKSRRAIARLGAVEEGVIRNERIMPDGRRRDSVRYSILDTEWPAVRQGLLQRLAAGDGAPGGAGT